MFTIKNIASQRSSQSAIKKELQLLENAKNSRKEKKYFQN